MAEFKNPNQQGGGDNRSLLVMMLVLVTVFFGLQYFRTRNNPQTVSPNAPATSASQNATPAGSQPATQPNAAAPAPGCLRRPCRAGPTAPTAPTVQASAESTTVVENELYRITFTNRGGQVSSWILKQYKDTDGKPLNLVHPQAAEQFGYPLSLYTYDAALTDEPEKGVSMFLRRPARSLRRPR